MDFPIPLRVSMVMMSHLSDISEGLMDRKELRQRSEFLKYLIIKYKNLEEEIMVDEVFRNFLEKYPQFK
jgi:hypothetical protein